MTLGKSPALSAPQFVPLQRARAGTVTSLSCSLPPVTLLPPQFGSGHITHPPPSPSLACLPHLPFQKEWPSPFLSMCGGVEPGRHWAADRDRRCGNNPSHSSRPPAGSTGPQPVSTAGRDTEGCLSGGPRFASEPSRSPLPPPQVAVLLGGGMWAAPLWEGGGKEGRRVTWTGCPQ